MIGEARPVSVRFEDVADLRGLAVRLALGPPAESQMLVGDHHVDPALPDRTVVLEEPGPARPD